MRVCVWVEGGMFSCAHHKHFGFSIAAGGMVEQMCILVIVIGSTIWLESLALQHMPWVQVCAVNRGFCVPPLHTHTHTQTHMHAHGTCTHTHTVKEVTYSGNQKTRASANHSNARKKARQILHWQSKEKRRGVCARMCVTVRARVCFGICDCDCVCVFRDLSSGRESVATKT